VTERASHVPVTTTRYWPDGKIWKVTDSENHDTVTNTYYGDGSLKQVKDAANHVTEYTYNGFMALDTTTYPDSTYELLTYDDYRRLSEKRGRSGQTISFTYDRLNRVTTKTVTDPNDLSSTITYQYDLLGRLYKTIDGSGTTKE